MKNMIKLASIFILLLTLIGCIAVSTHSTNQSSLNSVPSPNLMNQSIKKLAILVQAEKDVSQRRIEDEFITSLLQKNYQVASRSDLEQLMEEMNFQHSHITDSDAVRIGKVLNVPAVLLVAVTELQTVRGENYTRIRATLGARLVGVETGEILWIGTHNKSLLDGTYNTLLAIMARELSQSFPSR